MVDSRIQQAIADGKVPPGITAEFLSESRDRASIIGIVFVTALTFIVVVTRLISRSLIVRRIGIDDVLAAVSLVSTLQYRSEAASKQTGMENRTDSSLLFFFFWYSLGPVNMLRWIEH